MSTISLQQAMDKLYYDTEENTEKIEEINSNLENLTNWDLLVDFTRNDGMEYTIQNINNYKMVVLVNDVGMTSMLPIVLFKQIGRVQTLQHQSVNPCVFGYISDTVVKSGYWGTPINAIALYGIK